VTYYPLSRLLARTLAWLSLKPSPAATHTIARPHMDKSASLACREAN